MRTAMRDDGRLRSMRVRLFLLSLLSIALVAGPVGADEADEDPSEEAAEDEGEDEGEGEAPEELREATREEARELGKALSKASKRRDPQDALPAMKAIEGLKHEDFEKPLLKMLRHDSTAVALRAAELLEPRAHEDMASSLWRYGFSAKENDRRYVVKGRVLRILGRIGHELDKREYDDVERDWRWMVGNPDKENWTALADYARYFERTGDKRHSRWLAEWLDEPVASNPGSPTNPPASWWEEKWWMWKRSKPAVVQALEALTGKEFATTEDAKRWFEENEKEYGFEW